MKDQVFKDIYNVFATTQAKSGLTEHDTAVLLFRSLVAAPPEIRSRILEIYRECYATAAGK